jgi:hypothetical protein
MYLVGRGDIKPFVPNAEAWTAIVLSKTFGQLVSGLERVVEPNPFKRAWARLTGKTIGAPSKRLEALIPAVSDTWTKADAYLTDIEQVAA